MKKSGEFYTIISALIYGFTPVLCFYTFNLGNNSFSLTFFRNFLCLPVLLVIILYKRINLKIEIIDIRNIIVISIFGPILTTLLLYSGYKYIGVGTATTLHFLYPIFVVLICRFYYHDKIGKNQKISLLFAFFGIILFLDVRDLVKIKGVLMALTSGFTYSMYLVLSEKMSLSNINGYKLSFYLACTVSFSLIFINIFNNQITLRQPIFSFVLMLVVSILTSFIAVVLLNEGIKKIGSNKVSILCLVEPISAIFFGAVFLDEKITVFKAAGCILIVIGIYFLSRKNN